MIPSSLSRLSRPWLIGVMVACAVGTLAPTAQAADKKKAAAAVVAPLVKVDAPWIRAMVKGQTATGGFMTLTAAQDLTLVGFAMNAPGTPELHEMVMEGSVMRMRAIDTLALPAGQAVALRPGAGARHLMLTELKEPLADGATLKLTLKLRNASGQILTQEVDVPVKGMSMAPQVGMPAHGDGEHDHHGMHH